jgi:hypothetical protein
MKLQQHVTILGGMAEFIGQTGAVIDIGGGAQQSVAGPA